MYRRLLEETLPTVRERLRRAAARASRSPDEVRIVTVTKGHPLEAIEAALAVGLRDLGENRLEELEAKAGQVTPGSVDWHMVGHLQRRPASRVRELASFVHSLDSIRLAERLERTAAGGVPPLRVLVQVNVSREGSKRGFGPEELFGALERLLGFETLTLEGLMTMAPFTQDEGVIRRAFSGLRELREEAAERFPEFRGKELSMGMSNDFELAVEEGSTIVRIGSALLGERPERWT